MQTLYTDLVTLIIAAWLNDVDAATYNALSAVAGTNAITATGPTTVTAYAANQRFLFTPAVTNTAATTLNISAIGAKSIFWNGIACVGGELRASIPVLVEYDGTQFHIISSGFNAPFLDTHPVVAGSADSTKKIRFEVDGLTAATTRVITAADRDMNLGVTLGTEQASTSGTSIDFTSIPSGVRRITINFKGVSANGTSPFLIQLGDSGGIETSGYLGSGGDIVGAAAGNFTTGFGISSLNGAGFVHHGSIILSLEDSTDFSWCCLAMMGRSDSTQIFCTAGSKATSAELDRVRITTVNGTDAFDAGVINISYEF